MRKLIAILALYPLTGHSQNNFGIKAGANFANVTNASSINSSNSTGFMTGAFISRRMGKIMGSRTELIFSRQGYSYKTNTNTGKVNLNYLLFSQMMSFNITKFVQFQLGGFTGYLLNAKADSTSTQGTGNYGDGGVMTMMNRFTYGYGGGIEIYPYKGFMIGARFNMSLAATFKTEPGSGSSSPFFPGIDAKNNVVQLFAGYRF